MNIFNDDSNFTYLLNTMGEKIKINGKEEQSLLSNYKDKIIDYKKIKTIVPFNAGDLVEYQDKNWIIISEVTKNNTIFKATMRKCREIKHNNQLINGLVDSRVFDVIQEKYITLVDNEILITLSDKNYIKLNDILEFNKKAYKVIGIDDTKEGLLTLRCEYDATNTHFYSIELNATSTTIRQGETYQINTVVKDGEFLVENSTLIYNIADTNIATVNETGLITANAIGATTISVKYENVEAILNLEVLEAIPIKLMTISGDWQVYLSKTRTYTITYDDGSPVIDKIFTFSFADLTLATIQSSTATEVTLLGNSSKKGFAILSATCGDITLTKNIWVRSLI